MLPLNCGHLFNGIGGFALAAHWMGWNNLMHCEIDPFCNKVMNYHFPNSYQHEDIRTTDFTIWRNRIDLLTGGFPCQPYSTAGKRKGKDDDRHLWPEMLRAVREIQPGRIVGENVRGLTNWNGGLVFDEVQADLEAEGYEVLPFLLPAAGVNAPHRRDRIWFIAYANSINGRSRAGWQDGEKVGNCSQSITANANGSGFGGYNNIGEDRYQEKKNEGTEQREERNEIQWERFRSNVGGNAATRIITNANSEQLERNSIAGINAKEGWQNEGRQFSKYARNDWSIWPTQPPVCSGNDGVPSGLADIAFSKWRKESIKALGNAIVPQVAFQIFKAIEQYEQL